jgi:hypothetical protein
LLSCDTFRSGWSDWFFLCSSQCTFASFSFCRTIWNCFALTHLPVSFSCSLSTYRWKFCATFFCLFCWLMI